MDAASLLRMGLTLALVLAVPAGLLWGLRRLGVKMPGQALSGGRLSVTARLPLDARTTIFLVRRDAREQLLLLGPQGVTILEDEILLSDADRALQGRQAAEQEQRQAAAHAALRNASRRVAATAHAFSPDSFRKVLERSSRRAAAACPDPSPSRS